MKKICEIDKKLLLSCYFKVVFEMFDKGQIDYWEAYEQCFNEAIIEEIKNQYHDDDLVNALMLMSEYDTCRDCLTKDKIEKSKNDILNLLNTVIVKQMENSNDE